VGSSPPGLIQELIAALARDDRDGFYQSLAGMTAASWNMGPEELTGTVAEVAPLVPDLRGEYAKVAVFLTACLEWGASPLPLCKVLPARAARAMEEFARFPAVWTLASAGQPLPRWEPAPTIEEVTAVMVAGARRAAVSEEDAAGLAAAWFDVDDWLRLLMAAMQRRPFRAAMEHRDRVAGAAQAIGDGLERAPWVLGLALVLDDEPLVVLDRVSGRGFRLTMSGVGDNYQLHTLLADRLIDSGAALLAGDPPAPRWVAAATDGTPRVPDADPIRQRFRLFDGHGAYIFPEGRPSDIEPFEGVRVIVAEAPRGRYGWTAGRLYTQMRPTLTVDAVLEPAAAARWLSRVAPAREDDATSF
jgi:hypothetical protein